MNPDNAPQRNPVATPSISNRNDFEPNSRPEYPESIQESAGPLNIRDECASGNGALAEEYSFPEITSDSSTVLGEPTERLVRRLEEIVVQYKKDRDYNAVRSDFCCVSIALNHRAEMAPRFRPQPKVPRIVADRNQETHQLSRDKQVIDLHWLRCRNEDVGLSDAPWSSLFDAEEPFNFEIAAEFAAKNWKAQFKAEESLRLTPRQQIQLTTLQSNNVRDHCANLLTNSRDILGDRRPPLINAMRRWIQGWAEKVPQIREQHTYLAIWLAGELLDICGVGTVPIRHVAELTGLIDGAPRPTDRSIREKLKRLRNAMRVSRREE